MKEYTLLALISVPLTIWVDRRLGTRILLRRHFYFFLLFLFLFKLLVNGYLTTTGIVRYNPEFFLGIRLINIPLEDFLFGFSMITLTIVFWELFKQNHPQNNP